MHIWLQVGEAFARISMAAILNSLWEGLALALVAWLLLRTVPRANASLRYALWCLALIGVLALPVIALYASSTPLPAASAEPAVAVPQRFAQVLFALWYVVATILVLRLIGSYVRLQQLKASASPLPPLYQHRVRRWLAASGGHRECRLCVSDKVPMPVAIGLFDPVIVLPERLIEQLSEDELDQVGLHEIAHLQRWDDYTNVFQKIVEALLFFNPAVYLIGRQLTLEREIACDDRVIAATGKPLTYASCLTRLVEATALTRQALPALGALSTRRQFAIRIERLLEKRSAGFSLTGSLAAVAAVLVMAAALFAAGRISPLIAIAHDGGDTSLAGVAVAPIRAAIGPAVRTPARIAVIVARPRHAVVSAAVTATREAWIVVHSAIAKISRAAAVARSNAVGARNFSYGYRVSWAPYAGGRVQVFELKQVQVVTPSAATSAHAPKANGDPFAGIVALLAPDHKVVAQVGQVDFYVNDSNGHTSVIHARVAPTSAKVIKIYGAVPQGWGSTVGSYAFDSQSYGKASQAYVKVSEEYAAAAAAYAKASQQYAEDSKRYADASSAMSTMHQHWMAPGTHMLGHTPAAPNASVAPAPPAPPQSDMPAPHVDINVPSPSMPDMTVIEAKVSALQPAQEALDHANVHQLAALLRAETSLSVRQAIIERLQDNLDSTEAKLELIQTMLHDNSTAVRLTAVDALSPYLDQPEVQVGFISGLRSAATPKVKLAIIYSLAGRLHYTSIRDGLASVFTTAQPEVVQLAAAEALSSLAEDTEGQSTLVRALGSTQFVRVKLSIIGALTANIEEPTVRRALQAVLLRANEPDKVQLAAVEALAPAADDPDVRATLEQAGGIGCDVVRLSIKRVLSQHQSP